MMISTLQKTWALIAPSERRKALLILGLVVLMAAAETIGVLSIMPFLSVIARPEVIQEQEWLMRAYGLSGSRDARAFTIALGLASMCVVIISSAFKTVTLHLVNRFVHLQRHSLSTRLLSRYLRQPYEFFLARNSSVLGKNVLSEVDQLTFDLLQPLSLLIAQGAVVMAMVALVVIYDPQMAVVIVGVVGVLYGGIYLLVRRRLAHIGTERQSANAGRFKACDEALGGIREVKVTHTADVWLNTFADNSRLFSRHSATAETLSASPLYIVEAVGYAGLILISLFLLIRSNDVAHVLPALGLYGFASYRLLPAVQIMYRGFARLRFSSAALDSIHSDLALPDQPLSKSQGMLYPRNNIRLQSIRYAYPSAPHHQVLEDIDLTIPANTSVGITGPSGAGKSTLMNILLGLLEPQAGTLSVDGTDITPSNLASWQRAIGYVPQYIYLADTSVARNIAFGVPESDIDMAAVERAAKAAQIHEFVMGGLPQGYDTLLGNRGTRLSGGQSQRLGIARALYRDPPVLLFDEATSSLDASTEAEVNEAIRSFSGRKTVVVVAHKDTSLMGCQRVVNIGTNRPAQCSGEDG